MTTLRINERVAVDNLRQIKDIFDKNGIKFWLESGTLLGAVRDGKIIEWDSDVDLGTGYYNAKRIISAFPDFRKRHFMVVLVRKLCKARISRLGCSVYVHLYRKRDHYVWTVSTSGFNAMKVGSRVYSPRTKRIEKILQRWMNVLIQTTSTKPEGRYIRKIKRFSSLLQSMRARLADMIWYVLDRRGCTNIVVTPKCYFEKLATIQFYGIQFNIPSDVEKYLEFRYGKDWKTPRKIWKYKDDGAKNPKMRLCDFLVSTRFS